MLLVRTAVAALALLFATACTARPEGEATSGGTAGGEQISREQAIDIARQHLQFEPRSTEAEKTTEDGRPVWKVTFRGRPPGPDHAMGEFLEVYVDRRSGEIVSLAMS